MARRKHFFSVRPNLLPTPTLTVTSTPTQTVTVGLTNTPAPTRTLTRTPTTTSSSIPNITRTPNISQTPATPTPQVTQTSGLAPTNTPAPIVPTPTRRPWPPPEPTATVVLPPVPSPKPPNPSPYIQSFPRPTLDYNKLTPTQKLYYIIQEWSHPGDNPYKNFIYLYLKLNKLDIPFTEQFKAKLTVRKSKSNKATLAKDAEGKSIFNKLKQREAKIEELKTIWKLMNIG